MTQIQGILVEPSQEHCCKAEFYCHILLVSVISLSGIDCMLMKEDLLTTSHNVRIQLFPLALAVLSVRQDWKHAIPQVFTLVFIRTLYNHRSNNILKGEKNCIDFAGKLKFFYILHLSGDGMVELHENEYNF